MAMKEVLDTLRAIVTRWTVTETPLTSDTTIGSTTLNVENTKRFYVGDEIMIRNDTKGEPGLIVKSIVDQNTLTVTTPIAFEWTVTDSAKIVKTFKKLSIQNIYLGEPENIPKFPAITINAISTDSEPLTLDSWKETYTVEINVYVQSSNQEDTYIFLQKLTDTISEGLRNNFLPLVGPYNTTPLTQNIAANDLVIKVADSSIYEAGARIIIEDKYEMLVGNVKQVIDPTTIELSIPSCLAFNISNNGITIRPERFFYSAWPGSVSYNSIFKGTFLKASKITWRAFEEYVNEAVRFDTTLT